MEHLETIRYQFSILVEEGEDISLFTQNYFSFKDGIAYDYFKDKVSKETCHALKEVRTAKVMPISMNKDCKQYQFFAIETANAEFAEKVFRAIVSAFRELNPMTLSQEIVLKKVSTYASDMVKI